MSLLNRAQTVLEGLLNQPQCANCYWYGAVVVSGGQVSFRFPGKNDARCLPPAVQPPFDVGWDDPNGSPYVGTIGPENRTIAFTDCSGFVAYLIRNESQPAYESVPGQIGAIADPALRQYLDEVDRGHGQPWPSAADYAALGLGGAASPFESLGGNAALNPAALQPGDILAWALPAGSADTGHVVIVFQAPQQSSDGWWTVQVIDASILAHADDQRPCGTGVGLGTIALQSAAGGAWSVNFWPGVDQWHPVEYLSALRVDV